MQIPDGFDPTNTEQLAALQCVEQMRESLFLTGSAGTGKSYFLEQFCEQTELEYVKLAPTGLAALNVHGQTIHKFFKLPFYPLTDPNSVTSIVRKYRKDKREAIRRLELIIIDEVSMVRCDVLDAVDRILRSVRRSHLPFGGVQLLMVGDPFQLPPVTTTSEVREMQHQYPESEGFYFFDSRAYKELQPHAIILKKAYRQKSRQFVSALEEIRLGRVSPETVQLLNDRVNGEWQADLRGATDHPVVLFSHRENVDRYNEECCAHLDGEEKSFEGSIKGSISESSLPVPLHNKLRVGAQVMTISNDPDRQWVNGTTGEIVRFDAGSPNAGIPPAVIVRVAAGSDIVVTPHTWQQIEFDYDKEKDEIVERETGSYTQIPLIIAYAITVHKSQGQTCDRIVVDPSKFFAPGQGYVALSRCRTLEGLTLTQPLRPYNLRIAASVQRFYEQIVSGRSSVPKTPNLFL